MNTLMQEVKQCMSLLEGTEEGIITARFLFPVNFIGFKGHFPDRPILPGVCKIQAVVTMLQAWNKKSVTLKEIVLAKFFAPVSCNEELVFKCKEGLVNNGEALVDVSVTNNGKKIAKLQLKVNFEEEKQGNNGGAA